MSTSLHSTRVSLALDGRATRLVPLRVRKQHVGVAELREIAHAASGNSTPQAGDRIRAGTTRAVESRDIAAGSDAPVGRSLRSAGARRRGTTPPQTPGDRQQPSQPSPFSPEQRCEHRIDELRVRNGVSASGLARACARRRRSTNLQRDADLRAPRAPAPCCAAIVSRRSASSASSGGRAENARPAPMVCQRRGSPMRRDVANQSAAPARSAARRGRAAPRTTFPSRSPSPGRCPSIEKSSSAEITRVPGQHELTTTAITPRTGFSRLRRDNAASGMPGHPPRAWRRPRSNPVDLGGPSSWVGARDGPRRRRRRPSVIAIGPPGTFAATRHFRGASSAA